MKDTPKLIRGLPRAKLLKEIQYHRRTEDASRCALGFYLLDMERRGEYQAVGCASVLEFAEEVLGLQPREARELFRMARHL